MVSDQSTAAISNKQYPSLQKYNDEFIFTEDFDPFCAVRFLDARIHTHQVAIGAWSISMTAVIGAVMLKNCITKL